MIYKSNRTQSLHLLFMGILAVLFFLLAVPFAALADPPAADWDGLSIVIQTGEARTAEDNIVSRLWNRTGACVDSARDFGHALGDAMTDSGGLEGWRIRQTTVSGGGHTALILDSPSGNSYYVDNYFGRPEIQQAWKFSDTQYTMDPNDIGKSTGGILLGALPWNSTNTQLDITIGSPAVDPEPPDLPLSSGIPEGEETLDVNTEGSADPNAKYGPQGYGFDHIVRGDAPFPYLITFENLADATAPAQKVRVEDQLPGQLDFNTLQLGPVTVHNKTIIPLPGVRTYTGYIDLRPDRNVVIAVQINAVPDDRTIAWEFMAMDPEGCNNDYSCMYPFYDDDPSHGFLPPNTNPTEGQGSVSFSILPVSPIPNDSLISNEANIYFDYNEPIVTGSWTNRIDNLAPVSQVLPLLPVQTQLPFTVEWTGTDQGQAGIRGYDIYVSDDNGQSYTQWLNNTAETTAQFDFGTSGKTYLFFSVAQDNAGNIEAFPQAPDAQTTLSIDPGEPEDCNGEIGGSAFIDACGTCVGGNTSQIPCVRDCNGDWGGSAFIDDCSTCVGGNTGNTACSLACPEGDLDGDCDVDRDDRNLLRATLRKCAGDTGYNPDADYDTDGCITFKDYRQWLKYYKIFLSNPT